MGLTEEQQQTLTIVERVASVFSGIGVATILGTFLLSRHFRNPIHRIIFINAFYNIFDVTATMISLSGPKAGNGSTLCQFQGFLNQSFPLADVFWTLAMAIDVFLIVFYKYDAASLRKLEWKYAAVITALCGIPATAFLFIYTPEKGHMYGSVTIWCSVSPKWVLFRIIFYYGPIWLTIIIVMVLYGLVGVEILKWRREFRSIGSNYVTLDTLVDAHINISFDHFDDVVQLDTNAMTVEVNADQPGNISQLHDAEEKGSGGNSLSKSSLTTSHLRVPAKIPVDHRISVRAPVSFRQYILMPLLFFVVLLAVWVAPTTNRISQFVDPTFVSYPLYVAVGTTGSLRGFWNGVVFITIGMKERKRQKEIKRTGHAIG